jgi:tetratricopeptide (TPR) repeat protein
MNFADSFFRSTSSRKVVFKLGQRVLAESLRSLAEHQGSLASLQQSVDAYRAALQLGNDESMVRGETLNNFGIVLSMLAHAERKTALAEEAVKALEEALTTRTRAAVPIGWATTNENLGNALSVIGEIGRSPIKLYQAIDAYKNALEVLDKKKQRWQWASTKHNLANANFLIGQLEGNRDKLETSIALYQEALKARAIYPAAFAQTQQSLKMAREVLARLR